MSSLAALHSVSFFPATELLKAPSASTGWTMTHVLGENCKCSSEVAKYLIRRGPLQETNENVILLGSLKEQDQLQLRGFKVSHRDARSIASEKAVGVPFLMIHTPQGNNVYAGGYAKDFIRENTPIQDQEILSYLQGGKTPAELPIFGCAVSHRIQSLLDPMGFKYKESP